MWLERVQPETPFDGGTVGDSKGGTIRMLCTKLTPPTINDVLSPMLCSIKRNAVLVGKCASDWFRVFTMRTAADMHLRSSIIHRHFHFTKQVDDLIYIPPSINLPRMCTTQTMVFRSSLVNKLSTPWAPLFHQHIVASQFTNTANALSFPICDYIVFERPHWGLCSLRWCTS